MGYYHRWEEFPEKTLHYLADNPNCQGVKSRRIATDRIMVSKITVRGGGTIPRHYHEAEQVMLVQKGRARVTTGDKKVHELRPGDIWVIPSNLLHGIEYIGDAEALEIVSPPRVDTLIGYLIPHTFFEKSKKGRVPAKRPIGRS
jgi:quercetin dioxygenase-like cupin family protein